jgi:hypothetical protein
MFKIRTSILKRLANFATIQFDQFQTRTERLQFQIHQKQEKTILYN